MSQADVSVISEFVLLREQWQSELHALEQEINQFSSRVSAKPIDIPLKIGAEAATRDLEKWVADMTARGFKIPVGVEVNTSGGGFPSGAGSGGSGVLSSAAAEAYLARIAQALERGGMADGGTAESETTAALSGVAGGGSGRRMGLSGWARYIGPAFLTREALRVVQAGRELSEETALAAGDPRKLAEADLKFYSSVSHVPVLGQAANLIVDPFWTRELGIRQTLEAASAQDAATDGSARFGETVLGLQERASMMGIGGAARTRAEADAGARQRRDSIRSSRAAQSELLRKQAGIEAEQAGWSQTFVSFASFVSPGWGEQLKDENFAAQRQMAQIDLMRQTNLDRQAKKAEAANEEIRRKEYQDATLQEYSTTRAGELRVGSTRAEAAEALMRAGGNRREADDQAYSRRLQEEIELLRLRAAATKDAAEQQALFNEANARATALPDLVAARQQIENSRLTYENTVGSIGMGAVISRADEAIQRAGGDVRGASRAELERTTNDQIAELRARANDMRLDQASRTRANAQADNLQQQLPRFLEAQDIANARESGYNLAASQTRERVFNLQAGGQFLRAEELQSDDEYNQRINRLRDANRHSEADQLERERDASRDMRAANRAEQTRRINEQAREMGLRNDFRGPEADLARVREQYREDVFSAGGDRERINAATEVHFQRLRGLLHNMDQIRASTTSARDAYFGLQERIFEDPTGEETRSLMRERAGIMQDLQRFRPRGVGGNVGGPQAGRQGGGAAGDARADAQKWDKAADKWDRIADRILDSDLV